MFDRWGRVLVEAEGEGGGGGYFAAEVGDGGAGVGVDGVGEEEDEGVGVGVEPEAGAGEACVAEGADGEAAAGFAVAGVDIPAVAAERLVRDGRVVGSQKGIGGCGWVGVLGTHLSALWARRWGTRRLGLLGGLVGAEVLAYLKGCVAGLLGDGQLDERLLLEGEGAGAAGVGGRAGPGRRGSCRARC